MISEENTQLGFSEGGDIPASENLVVSVTNTIHSDLNKTKALHHLFAGFNIKHLFQLCGGESR